MLFRSRLLLYAGALGCPPARLAPHLQLRDYTISSSHKAHLCSSFTRCVVVCRCPWVPSCPFGASLAAARLHDLVLNKAHLCSSFTRLLLYAGALGCPPARLAPHLQLRGCTISSFNKAHLCSSFTLLLFVCSCPWVPSCTFGASLAAARLHDLVL